MAIPSDSRLPGSYALRQANAEQAYQQALTGLAKDQQDLFSQYGFKGNIDDQGQTSFELDPSRQFGLAQSMLRAHQSDLQDLRSTLRGQGLGSKGLAAKRTNLMRFLRNGDLSDLFGKFTRGASGIYNARTAALGNRNTENNSAESDALDWLKANPLTALAQQGANADTNSGNANYPNGAVNNAAGGDNAPGGAGTPQLPQFDLNNTQLPQFDLSKTQLPTWNPPAPNYPPIPSPNTTGADPNSYGGVQAAPQDWTPAPTAWQPSPAPAVQQPMQNGSTLYDPTQGAYDPYQNDYMSQDQAAPATQLAKALMAQRNKYGGVLYE